MRKRKAACPLKLTLLLGSMSLLIAWSCENTYPKDEGHRIVEIIPNPVAVGDTITIVISETPDPTPINGLDDITVLMAGKQASIHLMNTGAYACTYTQNVGDFKTFGNFTWTPELDSLATIWGTLIQCPITTNLPHVGKISVKLGDQEMDNQVNLSIE